MRLRAREEKILVFCALKYNLNKVVSLLKDSREFCVQLIMLHPRITTSKSSNNRIKRQKQ